MFMMLNALNKVTKCNHTIGVTTKLTFCDYLNTDLNSKYSNILICVCVSVCVWTESELFKKAL